MAKHIMRRLSVFRCPSIGHRYDVVSAASQRVGAVRVERLRGKLCLCVDLTVFKGTPATSFTAWTLEITRKVIWKKPNIAKVCATVACSHYSM